MRLAIAQINPIIGDIAYNSGLIADAAQRARSERAHLLITPELSICGYPPHDLLRQQGFAEACFKALERLAIEQATGGLALLVGFPESRKRDEPGKPLYNSAALLSEGKIQGIVRKALLPTYDVFDEQRHFEPWQGDVSPLTLRGTKLGVHICEDAWNDSTFWQHRAYTWDPVADLVRAGAEVLINLSASPWCHRREQVRESMFAHVCKRRSVPGVLVNQVGGNDSLLFDGHSVGIHADGGRGFRLAGFAEEFTVIDLAILRQASLRQAAIAPMAAKVAGAAPSQRASEDGGRIELDDGDLSATMSALEMGLRDYVAKTGFRDVVLGLSGGIDSALVAVIAARALGPERVRCIGMPGPHSSKGSVDDAAALCRNLGVRFDVIPVSGVYDAAMGALEPHFRGTGFGLAEENTQSRARGLVLMALSNKTGALVLACGNKSELAVGYATIYGDMCGALEVIGDLYKTQVYALCRHLNQEREVIPAAIIDKPPSAELRPDQKDSDTLPPYEVLDPILEGLLEDAFSVEQLVERHGDRDLMQRVVKLVSQNEHKRKQAPPVLRVSRRAFGAGRQMPIVHRYPG